MSAAGAAALDVPGAPCRLDARHPEASWPCFDPALGALLTALPEAALVLVDDRVVFANPAAQSLFGVDAAGLVDQPPTHLIHAGSIEGVRGFIPQLRAGMAPAPLTDVRLVRSDGEHRVVDIAGLVVATAGTDPIVLILRDRTPLFQARSALAASQGELQRLLAARDRIQEEERERIARELHDDLQQTLAAILFDVKAAALRQPPTSDVRILLDEAAALAAATIESTRRIVNDLRPQMLEELGLLPALEALVTRFRRSAGIDCRLQVSEESGGEDLPISPQAATCLYRVTQEGLRNIARHAQASVARVAFSRMRRGLILLRITDNGRGMRIDEPRRADSFGLIGMRERVRALGALLRVESRPGKGTTITVVVPASMATPAPSLEAVRACPDDVGEAPRAPPAAPGERSARAPRSVNPSVRKRGSPTDGRRQAPGAGPSPHATPSARDRR